MPPSFNPGFPQTFPRFVQHAISRFCAADEVNTCDDNRVDGRKSRKSPLASCIENATESD
jgi:hypothetical protein